MNNAPQLSVIIVSFNTRELTLECLRCLLDDLEGATDLSSEVWVVDNASSDGSAGAIRAAAGARERPAVKVIEAERNLGFGAANNLALLRARGEFVLFLNSDAFVKKNAAAALIEFLRSHPRAAVVGPRLLNADATLQHSCWKFPLASRVWLENLGIVRLFPNHPRIGDYSRWAHDSDRQVDFVSGACFLVRRFVYEQVGGFDEAFFMYADETDWQTRMRECGWQSWFTPSAEVIHLGGSSGGGDNLAMREEFFRSLDTYLHKHCGLAGMLSARVAMTLGSSLRIVALAFVWLVRPSGRAEAAARMRSRSWLACRQATRWRRQ